MPAVPAVAVEHPGEAASRGVEPFPVGATSEADARGIQSIETVIRRFLAEYPAQGRGNLGRLAASRNLWREVSSLTLLQLVAFVEQKFEIKVRPIDFAPQNFASVSAIARFVAARRPSAAAGTSDP